MRGSGHGGQDQLCKVHGAWGGGGLGGLPHPPIPAAVPQLLARGGGRGAAGGRGQPQDCRAGQVGRVLRAAVRTQVPDKVGVATQDTYVFDMNYITLMSPGTPAPSPRAARCW